jgi:DNA-binding PadR family transcriptional regulator
MMGKNEIDIIILAGLLQGPAHGYQLKQRIDISFGQFYINLSTGSLYTRLQKFEAEGLVEGRREQQEKLPDRKVFQLTEAGKSRLFELIATPVEMTSTMWPEMHDFTVHAVLFKLISKEQRRAVVMPFIERAELQQKSGMHAMEAYAPQMDTYMLATMEWGMRTIDENLKYFRSLLEME